MKKIKNRVYILLGLILLITIIIIVTNLLDNDILIEPDTVNYIETNIDINHEIEILEENEEENIIDVVLEPIKTTPLFSIENISENLLSNMDGKSYKENKDISIDELRLLKISYFDFNNEEKIGELIVNKVVAEEMIDIFKELYNYKFQIDNMKLIYNYDGDDNLSMENNNTSAFNYRTILNMDVLSNHGYGLAIDINPVQNPYVKGTFITPPGGEQYLDRSVSQTGMIIKDDICYNAFISRGWLWGGEWNSLKDYQHFEKKIIGINK